MTDDPVLDSDSDDPVCLNCLLNRVGELVQKLAAAWYSEDIGDAEVRAVDDSLDELYQLLFTDEPAGPHERH